MRETLLAAKTTDPVIPGTMSGILHPKVSNRFRVLYSVPAREGEDHDQIAQAMRFLTMQTIAVGIPLQVYNSTMRQSQSDRPYLKPIAMNGDLTIILEDDVGHAAVRALEYLMHRDSTIEIQKLDGNEGVLEVYLFGKCGVTSQQHTPLDYSQSTTCRRTLSIRIGFVQHGVLTPEQSKEL